jgi:hypothetical protein
MKTKWLAIIVASLVGWLLLAGGQAQAQYGQPYYQPQVYNNQNQAYQFQRFYYYPYYYFPHNYWPASSPRWPEAPGQPYMKPPAYMAFPPFHEPNWRYEAWQPQKYYRGFHFWLDQF